jgi:hypothetical protein
MDAININEEFAASEIAWRSCGCGGSMVELVVGTRLSVHERIDAPEEFWPATPLDAWTCLDCGRTDLFARSPGIFRT